MLLLCCYTRNLKVKSCLSCTSAPDSGQRNARVTAQEYEVWRTLCPEDDCNSMDPQTR